MCVIKGRALCVMFGDGMLNLNRLSKRENECIALLARGLRYQQIAFQLGTSVRTVEKQISSARIKLNADTIPHAIAIAVKESMVRTQLKYEKLN